ncbi:MAG: hypothetical protein J7K49_06560 [Thaumarchaeota archaeon]|nr:hypothetical protein [Nitrososphaerota archaeon]
MRILVMDIGKTKTFAIIIDEAGQVYAKAVTGPSGMWLKEETIVKNVREAIRECLSKGNLSLDELDLISISWADLDTKADWENAWRIAEKLGLRKEKTIIEHDAVAAYYAVTWGKPGIAMIAGTGSIGFGINKRGERARSGGWGWIIGDEGSAYWIAIKALNAVSRAYDGRGEKTILSKKLKEYFSIENELEILTKIYKEMGGEVKEIAKIAKIVDEAANEGDIIARRIMEEAGKELALCVLSIAKRLNMEKDEIIVGGIGGVYKSKHVRRVFHKLLEENLPNAEIREPLTGYTPILGPIIIAFKKLNIPLSEERVESILASLSE